MRITNILIFTDGGHRLFVRDYDQAIYRNFDKDHILGFVDVIKSLLNTVIICQQCRVILFENKVISFTYFDRTYEKKDVRFIVMLISDLDLNITFAYQKVLIEKISQEIRDAFSIFIEPTVQACQTIYQIPLCDFDSFQDQCDRILQRNQQQIMETDSLLKIPLDNTFQVPKERRVIEIIETFEIQFQIPNTAIFNEDALLIATGFKENYLDANILGGQAVKLFTVALSVVDEILAKPHHIDHMRQYLPKNLPKRTVILENIIVDTSVSIFNIDLLREENKPISILISSIDGMGYIAMIIENKANLELIEQQLPSLKAKIRTILFS
jgi:predicted regulator of Ras-like GTPase activity (Roadblock/LC7/MglB family)